MFELRVLNGYHRGAALPLGHQDEALIIGCAEDADVVLADPGVRERHARLSLKNGGWLLEPLDGTLRSADSNVPAAQLQLAHGEFARADHIWLTVVEENSPWQEPPPEPADVAADAEPLHAAEAEAEAESVPGAEENWMADEAEAAARPEMLGAAAAGGRSSRKRSLILAPLALLAVLSAAAAYAMTRTYTPLEINGTADAVNQSGLAAMDGADDDSGDAGATEEMARMARANNMDKPAQKLKLPGAGMTRMPLEKMQNMAGIAAPAAHVWTQDELRAAFRKRLEEVDLLRRFNLQLDDRNWNMQAALEEDDADRFQRMLHAFIKKYGIDFPVNARIGSAEAMLPFKIQQVISGNNASIVTDDGRRLYVGDEYRGVKLAGIEGNQLSFTGKRAINVTW